MTRRLPGSGSLRLRGRIWWLRYYADGQVVEESSKSANEREAGTLLTRRLAAIAEGRYTGREAARLTLANLRDLLADDYRVRARKSWDRAGRAFDRIAKHFGTGRKANTVTPDALARYVAARLEQGAARATVQKELAALKRAYNLACARGLLPYRPTFPALGEIHNARQVFVEAYQWALIRPELPEYWQDLGDVALATGWRVRGELRPLTWDRVDFDRGTLRLERYTTKNGDGRVFPFSEAPDVLAALRRRLAATQAVEQATGQVVPYVFHVDGHTLDVTASGRFYGPWRAACKRANFPELNPHDFRRSAVRNLERAGVPRSVAKRLIGHRTDAMYQRYAITTEDDLREAVRRVHQPAAPAET